MIQSDLDIIGLLHRGLQHTIQEKGWKSGLSEIQRKVIPIILKGEDCIIEAPTAGGKTEAVLFPTLTRASQNKKNSVQVLYLAPLRALLNDIELRAEQYSQACHLHCFKWHGDVGHKEKIDEFRNPSQLLLTTPESLEAILLRKSGWHYFFSDLECIIIDEAHNFASTDRGSHLIALLERLEFVIERHPQRIALSATIGNPNTILEWLAGTRRQTGKRIYTEPSVQKEKDFEVLFFNPCKYTENQSATEPSYRRVKYLYELLDKLSPDNKTRRKSIVYGNSRTKTENFASAINKLNIALKKRIPVKVRTHHSAVSKYYREEAEKRIKIKQDLESGLDAIISTSTLELGIDIGELDQVIQLDTLSSSSAFLQRVGRTGRRKGKPQYFRGLSIDEEDLVILTAVVSLGLKGISEEIHLPRKAFHILAHQLLCISLQNNGISSSQAWQILSGASCFSQISEIQFHELVCFMLKNNYLRDVDGELLVGEQSERYFLGSNWRKLFAVFDSGPMYEVFDQKKHVGTLDSAFVESLDVPFLFVLGGIEWEAFKVKPELRQVFAKKTEAGNAPKWVTYQGLDVPFETAKEAGRLLFTKSIPSFLNNEGKEGLLSVREKIAKINWREGKWILVPLSSGDIEIWTFSGDRINRTLAKLISEIGLGKATACFQTVIIKIKHVDNKEIISKILRLFSEIKLLSSDTASEIYHLLLKSIRKILFSKFTKCLPDSLLSEVLLEKVFDYEGLVKELKNNRIEIMNSFID